MEAACKMADINVNLDDSEQILEVGTKALLKALGPVGMAMFILNFYKGSGDYTAEKYNQPDESIDEIIAKLKKYHEQA